MPRNKGKKHEHDFTSDQIQDYLVESMGEMPLLTRSYYKLDYISISYCILEEKITIDNVEFGFSLYLGFDLYSAVCVKISDSKFESHHMIEEAKSIYDNLYQTKSYVGNVFSEGLKSFVHNTPISVQTLVERMVKYEFNYDTYSIRVIIDREKHMIIFS